MKQFLVIALVAVMLSGCMVNWPSNRTGSRWKDQPIYNGYQNYTPPLENSGVGSREPVH